MTLDVVARQLVMQVQIQYSFKQQTYRNSPFVTVFKVRMNDSVQSRAQVGHTVYTKSTLYYMGIDAGLSAEGCNNR